MSPQPTVSSSAIDFAALDRDGYVVLPGLISAADLAEFERCIETAGRRLASARGLEVGGGEPLSAVIKAAGKHRSALFDHVKRLWIVERLTGEIGRWLEAQGLFAHSRIEVPVLWPTLRADLPGESNYTFPPHQDYVTTRSQIAWRLWINLRDANRERGTIQLAPGSHRKGPYNYVTANTDYPHVDADELARHGLEMVAIDAAAGSCVLFDPRVVHGSVANRSSITKYVMLLHLQDLASYPDPSNPDDPMRQFLDLSEIHRKLRPQG
jgi:ectoine hydroxylase